MELLQSCIFLCAPVWFPIVTVCLGQSLYDYLLSFVFVEWYRATADRLPLEYFGERCWCVARVLLGDTWCILIGLHHHFLRNVGFRMIIHNFSWQLSVISLRHIQDMGDNDIRLFKVVVTGFSWKNETGTLLLFPDYHSCHMLALIREEYLHRDGCIIVKTIRPHLRF